MPSLTRLSALARLAPLAPLAAAALAGCRDPRAEANIAEAMVQVGTEISALRQDVASLQQQVDSLRMVAARQDSAIARLGASTGAPPPQR